MQSSLDVSAGARRGKGAFGAFQDRGGFLLQSAFLVERSADILEHSPGQMTIEWVAPASLAS